jgi:D-arabinose 1-dehydrogenase-like Zn-dependent alcohol dehydrogenase
MMKAVQLLCPGQPLADRVIEMPAIGPKEVLVRVKAAGVCHSDAHYRAGISPVRPLPLTLGHEVAGVIEAAGGEVSRLKPGDHVCLHYMVTCGDCIACNSGNEQFCRAGAMIGKHRDGGYAEFIGVPARSVFALPEPIPFEHGAILMCSSATSLHALNKARLKAGETVAVFGAGGLGMSAIQLGLAFGASRVYAVDLQQSKLDLARRLGAVPVNAGDTDPVQEIRRLTGDAGVDVALELIGRPITMRQAVQCLAVRGRAAIAGITDGSFEVSPYEELLNREAEIIGVSDHLAQEIPLLIDYVQRGKLDLSPVITRTVPLDAREINLALDGLARFSEDVRTVIVP